MTLFQKNRKERAFNERFYYNRSQDEEEDEWISGKEDERFYYNRSQEEEEEDERFYYNRSQ